MGIRKQLRVDWSCPPAVSKLYTTEIEPMSRIGFVTACVKRYVRRIVAHAQYIVCGLLVQKGGGKMSNKVSGKTHTKEQLDNWANQHNPNNKAYKDNANNRSNQLNPKHKTHQQSHNAKRRYKTYEIPQWAPDYPEYDD